MASNKVYPSTSVVEHAIKLSVCDAYSPKVWVTQCHFWPLKDTQTFEQAYDTLKEGLSRTLAELPGFAGTIGRTSQDPRCLVVNVGNDAHVEFFFEDLSSSENIPSYDALESQGFPMTGLVVPFSAPITLTPVFEGAPMLVAKLNKLKGGLALSFGFNHLLADASTVAEVERLWSLHTSDVNFGSQQSHGSTTNDEHYRQRLSEPTESTSTLVDEHWKVFPTKRSQLNLPSEPVNAEAALTTLQKAKEAHWAAMDGKIDMPRWCIWSFTSESLARLKKDAASQGSSKWISTMDALIGLFWSRIASIKQSSKDAQERSEMIFPINIRTRLDPPLDPTFHGNCVDIIASSISLADLETSDRTGLQAAAQRVRETVSGWSQAKWESWLNMACKLPDDQAICPNPLMLLESQNIAFNDYSKSQSHTLIWGELGQVARTRYMKPAGRYPTDPRKQYFKLISCIGSMAGCATGVVVHPRLADGGLEVATTSTDAVRLALEKDEIFAHYGKLTCAYA